MIVSASYRTDIPAFHADWFARRLQAGFALVKNPYGSKPYRVALDPDHADGFVFWTRNPKPFRRVLDGLARAGRPFYLSLTLTGYGPPWETALPDAAGILRQAGGLSDDFGPDRLVWRYDPILFGPGLTADDHRDRFCRLADRLAGRTDEVVMSVTTLYAKSRRNLAAAGVVVDDPPIAAKRAVLAQLTAEALARGLKPTLCAQPDLLVEGLAPASCIDAGRLGRIAGRSIAARPKGNRPGCACAESRDIGAYDSCRHGCRYCYAVADHDAARDRRFDVEASDLRPVD